jgi:hypothetical protein
VFKAGMDINCGNYVPPHLMKALADKVVTRSDLNAALTHLFDVLMRLGLFETEADQPFVTATPAVIGSGAHRQTALDAAVQGLVLLSNNNHTVPLAMATHGKSVSLVGADECKLGNYAAHPRQIDFQGHCSVASGLNVTGAITTSRVTNLSDACVRPASDPHAVVAILDTSCLGESMDRTSIAPADKDAQALAHVLQQRQQGSCFPGKPFVLVVLGACATDLTVAAQAFDAVLWAGAGGERGGEAISRVLFGMDVPSGRLPITMFDASVDTMSLFDMRMRPDLSTGYPGRTYRFHTGKQVFPAFHGLSYTTFSYTAAAAPTATTAVSAAAIDADLQNVTLHRFSSPALVTLGVTVSNTGAVDSPVSVLAFVAGPSAGKGGEPIRELVGFEKVALAQGVSATVVFKLGAWELSSTAVSGKRRAIVGHWTITVGDSELQHVVTVTAPTE